MDLNTDALLACLTVVGALVAMAVTTAPAELILVGAMVLLMAMRVVTPEQAVQDLYILASPQSPMRDLLASVEQL